MKSDIFFMQTMKKKFGRKMKNEKVKNNESTNNHYTKIEIILFRVFLSREKYKK